MRHSKSVFVPFSVGFVVMLVVAGYSLTSTSLDFDEGATLSAATRSTGELFDLAGYKDAVLAPFYLLLIGVVKIFGESDAALRLPSLLAMAAGAGVTAELGRRVAGQAAGIVAGIICSTLPSLVLFAHTARPYAFAFLFATLSSLLLLTAVRNPAWWRWALYGLCVALTGVFHLVALSVLAAHVVILAIAWWKERDNRLLWSIPAVGAALVVVAPLVWMGRDQRYSQLHWVETPTWKTIVTLPGDITFSPPVGYLLVGLAVAAYAALPARRYAELFALVAVPIVVVIGVSLVAPVWVPRYGIFLLAPLAVLAAATITAEHVQAVAVPRLARIVAIVVALAFLSLPMQQSVRQTNNSPDTRGMASAIHANAAAGDVIVYTDYAWSMRPTLTHYLGQLEWNRTAQPPDRLMKQTAAANGTLEATEFNDIQGRLTKVPRIWLIGPAAGSFGAPNDPLTAPGWKIKYISQQYKIQQTYTFRTGRAVLLVARTDTPAPA
ncbi:glycosyltransferase family 39 protein [Dactylosporangium sp. NPDC051541]|uniref:glycosyltransferase family 39 protein n=1 Tax=Dactylosporangium sp. NPDC051541 TaxID=3363977 RepID=UPI00378DA88B